MGEAKKKREGRTPVEEAAVNLTHRLINDGRLIEGGFAAYCVLHKIDVHSVEFLRLREAYMHGAEHLWSSIMATLDPGSEPTADDEKRMFAIGDEIGKWRAAFDDRYAEAMPTKGSA